MKTCTKCGETKELTEFYRNKRSKDGLAYVCKDCSKQQAKSYYHENKNKVRKYREENRERLRAYGRKHRETYYSENREAALEYSREYYHKNKDKIKEYRKKNQDKLRTYSARRRVARRGSLSDADVTLSSEWRRIISKMPCYYCGTDDTSLKYHIDHRIPVAKGGDDSWVNLVRACEPCNFSKSAKTDAEFFGWR